MLKFGLRYSFRKNNNLVPSLEERKLKILKLEEETWCLVWLAQADRNTKDFYYFTEHMRVINSILELKVEYGSVMSKKNQLDDEALNHF